MEIKTFFALFLHQGLQIGRADAEGVGFTGGVNVCEDDLIRQREGLCKLR